MTVIECQGENEMYILLIKYEAYKILFIFSE